MRSGGIPPQEILDFRCSEVYSGAYIYCKHAELNECIFWYVNQKIACIVWWFLSITAKFYKGQAIVICLCHY